MTAIAEKLMSAVLELPSEERALLAEKLIESLDPVSDEPLSPEWQEEIRRRCREIDEGRARLVDAAEVFEETFRALR